MGKQSEVTLWIKIKESGSAAIKSITHGLKEFGSSLFELKTLAFEAAAVILEQFGEKLVKAFAESEQGIIRLNAALRVTGRYTDEGSSQIQDMADKMSHLTDVSKDAAIGISATVAQYAKTLTPEQLANIQQAVIGLHALTGREIGSASMMIAKTLDGQMNALARLGIHIDMTATQQERYNQIMAKMGPAFKVAEEMNNSLAGQFTQFSHAVEEMEKELGKVIAYSLDLGDNSESATKKLERWREEIEKHIGTWVHWGQIVFAVFRSFGQFIVFVVRDIWNFGQITYRVLKGIVLTFVDLVDVFKGGAALIKASFIFTWQAIKLGAAEMYNFAVGIINQLVTKFNEVSPVKLPLFDLIKTDTAGVIDGAQGITDAWNKVKSGFGEIGDVWKDVWHDIKGDLKDLDDNANDLFGSYQRIIDLWNKPVRPNAAFNGAHKGGGANLGDKVGEDPILLAKRLEAQLKVTKSQFDNNVTGVDDFVAALSKLGPQLIDVLNQLDKGSPEFNSLEDAIAGASKQLADLGYTMDKNGAVRRMSWVEALNYKMKEANKSAGTLNKTIADMAYNTFAGFMSSIQTAFQALIDGSQQAGLAFAQAMLGALAQVAQGFGQFFLGRAAGAIAEALLPSSVVTGASAGGFAAAAKFTVAAAAMFALSGILGGLANRAGAAGGSGGGGSAGAQQQTNAVANDKLAGTIIIEGGLLDMSDPRQADAFSQALTDLADRRIIVKAG